MTEAQELARAAVAELRTFDDEFRAKTLGPLAVLENLPDTPAAPPFVLGHTLPDESNVGAGILGPVTKTVTSPAKITATEVHDTRFENWVDVTGPWVQFVNCEFVGPATYTTPRALVKHWDPGIVQSRFDFCTFAAQTPGADEVDGIAGHRYHLNRCDLHHLDDGFAVFNPGGVTVTGSWVHDLVWFAKAQHADGSHADCFQVHNGGRLTVIGSRLDAYLADDAGDPRALRVAMSAGMMSPSKGTELDLLIAGNWVNGGQVGFNFGAWTTAAGTRRIVGNRWGTTTPILAKKELALTIVGNTRDGTAENLRRNG
jgi:hypothetical protein